MPAYVRETVATFLDISPATLIGRLERAYAEDGYATQFTSQILAWNELLPMLQAELRRVTSELPAASAWSVLLEYPLYRLRKRIDVVLLADAQIIVLEAKVGEGVFRKEDLRQVEE